MFRRSFGGYRHMIPYIHTPTGPAGHTSPPRHHQKNQGYLYLMVQVQVPGRMPFGTGLG